MLEFRPHHFFCTLGFEGKGYSEEFVENFQKIADSLRNPDEADPSQLPGDHQKIRVVSGSDSICSPCPNRVGDACATEKKISALDAAHAQTLGIKPGDELTWLEAKRLLAEKMTVQAHRTACAPCAWRSMGVCEAALMRLKQGVSS